MTPQPEYTSGYGWRQQQRTPGTGYWANTRLKRWRPTRYPREWLRRGTTMKVCRGGVRERDDYCWRLSEGPQAAPPSAAGQLGWGLQ